MEERGRRRGRGTGEIEWEGEKGERRERVRLEGGGTRRRNGRIERGSESWVGEGVREARWRAKGNDGDLQGTSYHGPQACRLSRALAGRGGVGEGEAERGVLSGGKQRRRNLPSSTQLHSLPSLLPPPPPTLMRRHHYAAPPYLRLQNETTLLFLHLLLLLLFEGVGVGRCVYLRFIYLF